MNFAHAIRGMNPRRQRISVAIGAAMIGVIVAAGIPSGAFAGTNATIIDTNIQLPAPTENLAQARQASPFPIELPTALPADSKLLLVDWIPPQQNNGAMNVDIVWTSSIGDIHLFETNNPNLTADRDPADPQAGTAVEIDGRTWILASTEFRGRSQIATRLPSGVIVEVDAVMSDTELEGVAASIP